MKIGVYLEPEINRKIIRFFLENPSSIDTSRGIATWINADIKETGKALRDLAKAKILITHGTGATAAYGCTTDACILSKIEVGLKKYKPR